VQRRLRFESLEARYVLSGVTLLTHGFGGDVDDWITAMANAIAARDEVNEQPRYVVQVTDPGHDGGPLEVVSSSNTGPSPNAADTADPEIVILLDWSDVAGSLPLGGYTRSTIDVADAVAEAFASPNFLDDLATPIVELPLHLIGHSRGASLVAELARNLGEFGIWVDHVTTLDPHPVDGVREPEIFGISPDFGDPPMAATETVVFWGNYWRTEGDHSLLDVTGEPVADTHDVQLDEDTLNDFAGYGAEHSDTHLWYHGTIDTTGPIDDSLDDELRFGFVPVPADAPWYDGDMGPRDGIGFHFSRIGNGARPTDGISKIFEGNAEREEIADHTRDEWPSIAQLAVTSPSTIDVGQNVEVSYFWHDRDGGASFELYLDSDRNPLNGPGQLIDEPLPLGASDEDSALKRTDAFSTTGAVPGEYELLAVISEAGHTRYAYARDPVTLRSISLDNHDVQGNVSGALVGRLTVVDPGASGTHVLTVDDPRFEVDGDRLMLREDASLPGDVASNVTVEVTASRAENPSETIRQTLQINILANPTAWQNSTNPLDTTADGFVVPNDVLVIINELTRPTIIDSFGRLPTARPTDAFFYDVDGDGFAAPVDVLQIINSLTAESEANAESSILTEGISVRPAIDYVWWIGLDAELLAPINRSDGPFVERAV
jgi:hypothetical protein